MTAFLAPGWTCTAPIFWLPTAAVLPVLSNDRDDPRNVPENMVTTAPDDFVLRDPARAARFLISSVGDRLTIVGVTWPETVRRGVFGQPLTRVLDSAPFQIAPGVSILEALAPDPNDRATAARLILRMAPPLWTRLPDEFRAALDEARSAGVLGPPPREPPTDCDAGDRTS